MLELAVVIVAAVFLLAGFVKGVLGLGLPTISMGLLAVTMAPGQAAAMLVVPSLVDQPLADAGGAVSPSPR